MSYVLDNLAIEGGVYACARCGERLPGDGEDFHDLSGSFDLSLDVGQDPSVAPGTDRYVLRHYACRSCGALFDVEMRRTEDDSNDA